MNKADVIRTIAREYGEIAAMAIGCALEVAAKRWTGEDTVHYGYVAKNVIEAAL